MRYLAVFFTVLFADMFWTMYMIETDNRKAGKAAFWSALIVLCSGYTTRQYVESKETIIAAAAGAFVGTALTIMFKKKKEENERINLGRSGS